jgi:DNA (cytosine-5)-methyltransferase 1
VPKWRDIRELTGQEIIKRIGRPTLISGGFPCQPHSLAGKRKASCDDRDLWPEFRRIIRHIRSRWVLLENVPGIFSSESGRFLGKMLWELSKMGYNVRWGTWEAADVGINQERERVFFIARLIRERTSGQIKRKNISSAGQGGTCRPPHMLPLLPGLERGCITESILCRNLDGFPGRVDRIECLGNAVVPQQVYPILKAIADIEKERE